MVQLKHKVSVAFVALLFAGLSWGEGDSSAVNLIQNGSFEGGNAAKLSAYGHAHGFDTVPGGWTSVAEAGWAQQGAFCTPAPKDGVSVGFVQLQGQIRQTFNVTASGYYRVSYYAIGGGNYAGQTLSTVIDPGTDAEKTVFEQTTFSDKNNWSFLSSDEVSLEKGDHVLAIQGHATSGYKAAAIDCVSVTFVRPLPIVTVEGWPIEAGTPDPVYGEFPELKQGDSKTFKAPASAESDGLPATCLGWKLYRYDETAMDWVFDRQSDASNKTQCDYVHGTEAARLVWQWEVRADPMSKIKIAGKGQVSASVDSIVLGNPVTFTAEPNAGFVFGRWEGADVPAGQESAATIEVSVNNLSPLTAVFLPDGTGSYEAGDYVAQDNLLAHWDGIENAGRGYRDSGAETWVDLTGKQDGFVFPNGPDYRDGKCYYLGKGADGQIHAAVIASAEDIARTLASGKATIEVVYKFNSMVSSAVLLQCADSRNGGGRVFYSYVNGAYALGCVDYLQNTYKILNKDSSPTGNILSYSFCFEDMTIKKNGADTGWTFLKGSITPDYSTVGLAVGSFFNWANGQWVMQSAAAANDANIYAVRIYDRQLTADELARNWAIDQARFVNGRYSVRGVVRDIRVEGAPAEIGTPTPGYGEFSGLKQGDRKTFTAPASVDEDGLSATCLGWKLYRYDEVTMDWVLESESDAVNKTRCDFTQGDWTAKLVWQWDARAEIRTTTSGTGSGRVTVSADSAAPGETVTCTAEPADGSAFDHWEGAVPAGSEREPVLEITVGGSGVSLTAIFARNVIQNGSFEGGDVTRLDSRFKHASFDSLPGGWTGSQSGWAQKGTWYPIDAKDGTAAAYMQMNGSSVRQSFEVTDAGYYRVSYFAVARGAGQAGLALSAVIDEGTDAAQTVIESTAITDPNNWVSFSSDEVLLEKGVHELAILGSFSPESYDRDAAVDCVSVALVRPLPVVTVEGQPVEVGEPDPGYGKVSDLRDGDEKVFTAPASVAGDGFAATCLGWKLYLHDGSDWVLDRESNASNKTRCEYVHGTQAARLVWQWDCRAEIRTTTSGSGSVSVSENPAPYGALVTCTAEPANGSVFDHWEGDAPAGSVRSPSLSLTAGTNAVNLTAVFVEVGGTAENLVYVGANGGSWDEASNWRPEKVPTLLDNVTISGKGVVCGGTLRARSVTVDGGGASLTVGDGLADLDVSILGDFVVTGGAQARFRAGRTDGIDATDWENSAKLLYAKANATSVVIGGLLKVGAGSTLYAQNDALTGTPVFFRPQDFTVEANATVSATGLGFQRYARSDWTAGGAPVGATFGVQFYGSQDPNYYSYAFGKGIAYGDYGCNAGYGGASGKGAKTFSVQKVTDAFGAETTVDQQCGGTYGFAAAPFLPGSPEGAFSTAENHAGGGSVCVFASGAVTVDGTICADADGWSLSGYAGASGGSVWLAGKVFSISRSAELTARGGNNGYSDGTAGGGRIALTAGASQMELDALAAGQTPGGLTTAELTDVNANVSGGSHYGFVASNAGTLSFAYAGSRVVPTHVTAEGEETGVVSPVYGFHVFDRVAVPEFSNPSGAEAAYDAGYRNRRRSTLSKIVFTDATGEIESLATAVGQASAMWTGEIESSLRVRVVGGGAVTVNGTAYDADAEIWLPEDAPVTLTAADGTGSFVKFVGDIPGGVTKEGTVSVPVRPGMIVQAVFSDAVADEKTFVGADGAFWDEDANWEPAGVPTALDAVTVTNAVKCYNVLAAGSLVVDGGAVLVGGKEEVAFPTGADYELALRNESTVPDEYVCAQGFFVTGDVTASGAGRIELGARGQTLDLPDVEIGGGLTLTDEARMTVHARPYPADAERDADGRPVLTNFYRTAQAVRVGGALTLQDTAVLVPDADNWTGNPVRFDVGGNVTVGEGAKIDARMRGFGWVNGETLSTSAGTSYTVGGTYAGLGYAPYAPGAPCGFYGTPTRGGGVIWIKTPGRIVLDGTLDASGACRLEFGGSGTEGGSSGGGIWLVCFKLAAGENAKALAYGGYGNFYQGTAGGGGGSICLTHRIKDDKLALLAEGKPVKSCTTTDEIKQLETDVTGHLCPTGGAPAGPSGTTATVMGGVGMVLIIR